MSETLPTHSEEPTAPHTPHAEYYRVMREFLPDLMTTFPELKDGVHPGLIAILREDYADESCEEVFKHTQRVLLGRFFEVLYQVEDIFTAGVDASGAEIDTEFIPGIVFKSLWKENISEQTRTVIWKYLQLLLFSIVNETNNGASFGDSLKLFEAMDPEQLQSKLEEVIGGMEDVFKDLEMQQSAESAEGDGDEEGDGDGDGDGEGDGEDAEAPAAASGAGAGAGADDSSEQPSGSAGGFMPKMGLPDPQQLHDHIRKMMGGKLGALAHEIAEETAKELNLKMDDAKNVQDVFKRLLRNPGKLIEMVKSVGTKLEGRLKSGEIKESELMREASEMMSSMKSMPGMKDIQKMMQSVGMNMPANKMAAAAAGLAGGGKINLGAMKSVLGQNMRRAQMMERMQKRLDEKRTGGGTGAGAGAVAGAVAGETVTSATAQPPLPASPALPQASPQASPQVFKVGTGAEKTPRMTKQEYVSYSKKNAKAKGKKK